MKSYQKRSGAYLILLCILMLGSLSNVDHVLASPTQVYSQNFLNTCGGYARGTIIGLNNSWTCGHSQEMGGYWTDYAWATSKCNDPYGWWIYGGYYSEHSYVMTPKINLSAYTGNTFSLSWDHSIQTYPGDSVRVQVSNNNGM